MFYKYIYNPTKKYLGSLPIKLIFLADSHFNSNLIRFVTDDENLNIQNEEYIRDILFAACASDNSKIIELLLGRLLIDVNVKNQHSLAPLHVCAMFNSTKALKLLLKHNADINITNNESFTPLFVACYHKNISAIKLLLEDKKIDLNIQELQRVDTVLHMVCRQYHKKEEDTTILKLLLNHQKLNINLQNNEGNTALHEVIKNNTYRQLISSKNGWLGLEAVVLERKIECNNRLNLLLNHTKLNIDAQNNEGNTALGEAVELGLGTTVRLLLSFGATISENGIRNVSPLSIINILNNPNSTVKDINKSIYTEIYNIGIKFIRDPYARHLLLTAGILMKDQNGQIIKTHLLCELLKQPNYKKFLDYFHFFEDKIKDSHHLQNFFSKQENIDKIMEAIKYGTEHAYSYQTGREILSRLDNVFNISKQTFAFRDKLHESRQNKTLTDIVLKH